MAESEPIELPSTPEALAYEAKEVQLLLSKELVQRAFAETENQIVGEWKRAKTSEDREACWQKLQGFLEWRSKVRALATRTHLHTVKE